MDSELLHGVQVPKHDPLLLVTAVTHVTKHLGFGVTCTLSFEPPALLARRFTTLDHLTQGRIGWNIVTGYYDSGAKALGRASVIAHDERYEIAEGYMTSSTSCGSRAGRKERSSTTGRAAFMPIRTRSTRSAITARISIWIQFTSPALSAAHGAAVPGRPVAPIIADIRAQAERFDRDGRDIRFFTLLTVTVAETEAAARANQAEYQRHVSPEGVLTLFSGWIGIDFSRYPTGCADVRSGVDAAVASMIESFTIADPDRVWTLRDLIAHNRIGGRGPVVVGSTEQALLRVGIDASVRSQEFAAYVKRVYTDRAFNFAANSMTNTFDPTIGVQRLYWSKNFKPGVPFSNGSHYINLELDRVPEAVAIETDPGNRRADFASLQQTVARDLPDINFLTDYHYTLFNKRLLDHTTQATGISSNLADAHFACRDVKYTLARNEGYRLRERACFLLTLDGARRPSRQPRGFCLAPANRRVVRHDLLTQECRRPTQGRRHSVLRYQKTSVRTSMLSRGGAPSASGFSNDV